MGGGAALESKPLYLTYHIAFVPSYHSTSFALDNSFALQAKLGGYNVA